MKVSKSFFLISFLPALAYWYLEEHYPVRIAIAGGLALATLEILVEKFWTKHVHGISKFNFFLILFLGGISLLGEEGIWFKLQPMFTGIGIGGFLLFKLYKGKGLMVEMMESLNQRLPPIEIFQGVERNLDFLFLVYGLFMGGIATWAETKTWLFFKTLGFYFIFAIFLSIEMVRIRLRLKKYYSVSARKF